MADSEQGTFVFAVTFLIIFAGLFASMPTALFGLGGTATTISDVDPSLLTDFAETVNWTKSAMTLSVGDYFYYYDLGGYQWECYQTSDTFYIRRKVTWIFGLWFGVREHTEFFLENGTSRGEGLTLTEIADDANDGAIRYNLRFTDSSNEAGGFVFYWNTTLYSDPADAWANDELNLLHGIGVTTPNTNVVALLLGLLTFQIPNIPTLPNLIIVTPIAVCVIFLLWFLIKESLPFW